MVPKEIFLKLILLVTCKREDAVGYTFVLTAVLVELLSASRGEAVAELKW